jgi:hypothetical protein
MLEFGSASERRLKTCHPDIQRVLRRAISIAPEDLDFSVVSGKRGKTEQNQLVVDGASQVSYPDSTHNAEPLSDAGDVHPWPLAQSEMEFEVRLHRIIGFIQSVAVMEGVKLEFGADWTKFRDVPHIQRAGL